VRLSPVSEGTKIDYDYTVKISGTAAAVGGRMLDGATKMLIKQFFQRLVGEMQGGPGARPALSWWRRLLQALGF
jgi:2-furoyl-CoA dehydrogenase large subunit